MMEKEEEQNDGTDGIFMGHYVKLLDKVGNRQKNYIWQLRFGLSSSSIPYHPVPVNYSDLPGVTSRSKMSAISIHHAGGCPKSHRKQTLILIAEQSFQT
ncbi:hypothetical protein CDAR_128591 [Caerostris darwini]|uniref:Uncharacterized protein n=1 Tax=Caerostris darwini TaxID=1538125 RepID=A0AAV4NJC8_9ARAC|nr:hypothetical protein CDAR_128591 [Caerostris darwini]